MKSMNYAALSSICALIIGVLLVVWPDVAINYLVITIGALFLLPGMAGLFSYMSVARKQAEAGIRISFPVIALGSTLFGFWLMITPSFFVNILMYVLGVLLVFGGLSQIMNFMTLRNYAHVPRGVCVIPVRILSAGIVVLFNPFEVATIPFIILGVSSIVYGATDLIRLLEFKKRMREQETSITDVTPIEEIKE